MISSLVCLCAFLLLAGLAAARITNHPSLKVTVVPDVIRGLNKARAEARDHVLKDFTDERRQLKEGSHNARPAPAASRNAAANFEGSHNAAPPPAYGACAGNADDPDDDEVAEFVADDVEEESALRRASEAATTSGGFGLFSSGFSLFGTGSGSGSGSASGASAPGGARAVSGFAGGAHSMPTTTRTQSSRSRSGPRGPPIDALRGSDDYARLVADRGAEEVLAADSTLKSRLDNMAAAVEGLNGSADALVGAGERDAEEQELEVPIARQLFDDEDERDWSDEE